METFNQLLEMCVSPVYNTRHAPFARLRAARATYPATLLPWRVH